MAKRIFSDEEREEYRDKMLAAGFPLLKQYGLTHMSVEKITQAAGIGVSTFYNFFGSKEEYLFELLAYRRKIIPELIKKALNGKAKAGREEIRQYLKFMIDEDISVFPYLSPEDEQRLLKMVPQAAPDLQKETQIGLNFMTMIENPKKDIDMALVGNLVKIYVLAAEGRAILHEAGYERTMDCMRDVIIDNIIEN